ncbi:tyrosine-protein phosphatase [Capnocytophaga cynodegmi]|uniref:Tyrosine specific protein phosphatases domain-containing protein n=1 Tax=Capnocytophaga cynodegmi TaxID=28189 RepID=A0A0B7HWJ0_9FLAO|nr:tyrosine-protein phosphatase [Capnocytophaga cynodegmi]CEN34578.1 conserved hypothetical protein [Capnocytophaga cynodegmi]CEN41913.1 conserved hypothetical protein [Capnocytophaga cynodegmi]
MKQLEIIKKINSSFKEIEGIKTALLIGSFARKEATVKSDVDYSIWIDEKLFNPEILGKKMKEIFPSALKILQNNLRNRIVIYFEDCPRAEIVWYKNLSEIDKNFLGSEITDINYSLIYVLPDLQEDVKNHLKKISDEKQAILPQKDIITKGKNLTDNFLYEFETTSNLHSRSDSYRFYFHYNIALQMAVQLNYLSLGNTKQHYLPKHFSILMTGEKFLEKLNATTNLEKANDKKRFLLDFFYAALERLNIHSEQEINEIKSFLEAIYKRDYLWNFRDISLYNNRIKEGIIYRTATLTLFQKQSFFDELLKEKNIKTVIDLRADRELLDENLRYNENSLKKINYCWTPFDPWKQTDYFKENFHYGTDIQIAYRFFAVEGKSSIKKAIEAILAENQSVAIHCFAGKDRTGAFVSLLHLLSEADKETIYTDYLATEVDTNKNKIDAFLEIIEKEGGIIPYLRSCSLSDKQIQKLKQKILKNE